MNDAAPFILNAGRQAAPSLDGIRRDHVERYYHAMAMLRMKPFDQQKAVLDAACGVGFGSYLLATDGHEVTAVDICRPAVQHGIVHFDSDNIVQWIVGDLMKRPWGSKTFDAVVCLETLEHLDDAPAALALFRDSLRGEGALVVSVPNEDLYPFVAETFANDQYPHRRHYRPAEIEALLIEAGFEVVHRGMQIDKVSPVLDGTMGRFLVYTCRLAADPWLQTR